jgi:hypothetical protein
MTRESESAAGEGATDGLTPEAAFAILGNEYRAAIVRALGDAQGTTGPRVELAFSDLYDAADVDVATSQFNYHLQQLVGPFVDRTEAGYRLRHEGVELYRTIVAGTYTAAPSLDRFEVGADCFHCGAPIEATYEDRRFTVACSACDRQYSDTTVPPSAVEGEADAVLARVDQYLRQRILAFSKGACSNCANGLDTQFIPGDEVAAEGADHLDVFVHRACQHCGAQQYLSVGLALLYDARVVAFFETHGVDVTETPVWELEFAMTDRHVDVRSRDPWDVALTLDRDGDELELDVTEALDAAGSSPGNV